MKIAVLREITALRSKHSHQKKYMSMKAGIKIDNMFVSLINSY